MNDENTLFDKQQQQEDDDSDNDDIDEFDEFKCIPETGKILNIVLPCKKY